MTKMIYSGIAFLALALATPVAAQSVVIEQEPVEMAPSSETIYTEPGTVRYYRAPRDLDDRESEGRSANEISPNETDHFYQQMEREGRAGTGQ